MVEVLVDGQFGYYATPNMTQEAISAAAKKAYNQAKISSKHAIYRSSRQVSVENTAIYCT